MLNELPGCRTPHSRTGGTFQTPRRSSVTKEGALPYPLAHPARSWASPIWEAADILILAPPPLPPGANHELHEDSFSKQASETLGQRYPVALSLEKFDFSEDFHDL